MRPVLVLRRNLRPRGAALAAAILVMTLMLLIGLVFIQSAMTESNVASNATNLVQAFYVAEAGLEAGYQQLRIKMNVNKPTSSDLAAVAPPAISNSTLSSRFTLAVTAAQVGANDYSTTIDRGAHRGLRGLSTDYEVTATATGPRGSRVALAQATHYLRVPLFQFGFFYGRGVALAINTGPEFTFNGRVHSNGNLYITDSCCGRSWYDSTMTAAGNFYMYRPDYPDRTYFWTIPKLKDSGGSYQLLDFDRQVKNVREIAAGDTTKGGSVNVQWDAGSLDYWKSESIKRFGGMLLDSAHGVEEITPPLPDLFNNPASPDVVAHKLIEAGSVSDDAGLKANKLYYKADVVIKDGAAYTWNAGRTALNALSLASCSAGTLSQVNNFTDKREGKIITLRQVDVAKLTSCLGTLVAGWNQTLYVYETTANTGVRLINGGTLPSGGLTVVSENPVYVAGDYNTTNKQAAAVLADAVTSLSNAWMTSGFDAKSNNVLSDRIATATTQNFAMAHGPNVESTPGVNNGHGENAIRYLEDWTNKSHTYSGSIVGLWHSTKATGGFIGPGTYYNPPNRTWGYDTLFNTLQPPSTPMGVVVTRGAWVKK
jgi:Tfp pilus assembly protein PilX